jgi:hypothetical protein
MQPCDIQLNMECRAYRFGEMRRRLGELRVVRAPEKQEIEREERSVWDRILGVSTVLVVSLGGWAAIIELVRRLLL